MLGRLHPALLLSAFALVGGCDAVTYEPSGENRVEVTPPQTGIVVDLDAAPDTLTVWGNIAVRYRFDLGGKPLVSTDLYVDGVLLSRYSLADSLLQFDSRELEDGFRTVRVVAYAASQSGSLADVLGAETVAAAAELTLLVDNAAPSLVEVMEPDVHEGQLRIRWERYGRLNFRYYEIYRYRASGDEWGRSPSLKTRTRLTGWTRIT